MSAHVIFHEAGQCVRGGEKAPTSGDLAPDQVDTYG